jgi:hypothetical protein
LAGQGQLRELRGAQGEMGGRVASSSNSPEHKLRIRSRDKNTGDNLRKLNVSVELLNCTENSGISSYVYAYIL